MTERSRAASARYEQTAATFVAIVRQRAERMGERSAYTFLADGELLEEELTYLSLDRRARALAAAMMERATRGERALLLVAPGPDFVCAFFACLYAGLIAVPVPLPSSKRGLPRVLAIARDCRPSVVLSPGKFGALLAAGEGELSALRALPIVALEAVADSDAELYRAPRLEAETVAFLQYTSGSTGTPKGVVLTHANLLANERAIARAFDHDEASVVVGWLPPFHDMGLIGNVLQPIFLGARGVHMTPQHFLAEPLRWLRAIARYGATTSGGPNFAYDLCVQKVAASARQELDLTSWRVAFNGAEPVRAATLNRFARAFATSRFSPRAFYPCYGLAEATLLVSGGEASAAPVITAVEARALEAGQFVPSRDGAAARGRPSGDQRLAAERALVGAGSLRNLELRIVDPESRALLSDGAVGEIWVRGASVAHGYWERAEESAATFAAFTSSGEGPFLRTGDLGALREGELFVTGRLKDLIIVRGRNLYPQDLEVAAAESAAETRAGGAAAFALEPEADASDERIVIVQEVARSPGLDGGSVVAAIRNTVAERFELAAYEVVLIAAGTLPRTTSGKVQRRLTRERYLAQGLHVCFRERTEQAPTHVGEPPRTQLERELAAIWEVVLGRAPGTIARDQNFVRLGGDSLAAAQIAVRVSAAAQMEVAVSHLFECATIAGLAALLERAERVTPEQSDFSQLAEARFPLSRVQERLWFFEQLADGEPVHHVAGALWMHGALDVAALERAVNALIDRHETLRARFVSDAAGVHVRIAASERVLLTPSDVDSLNDVDDVRRPFALGSEAPVRFRLLRVRGENVLLFVAHHLVVDGWSTALLARELRSLYRAARAGASLELTPIGARYAEFAASERQREESAQAVAYWKAQFATLPEPLDLATDRPRPALQSHRGDRLLSSLPRGESTALCELAREHEATPFVALTAAWAAFLARESGCSAICLGTPVMVRRHAREESVVGCYLNTLPLRIDLAGEPSFVELLVRVQKSVIGAQAHRDLSFERILELAREPRELSRTPLFQAMIALQPRHELEADASEPWRIEQLATGSAQFELSLDLIPRSDGSFELAWEFNRDLFDRASIAAMAARFVDLVARAIREPQRALASLPWPLPQSREEERANAQPFVPVHVQFARVARETPEAEALVSGTERLSYRALHDRVQQLARALRARGLFAETCVAVYAERSPELVIAVLAVLTAGGTYIALDPRQPLARTQALLAEAKVELLIAREDDAAVIAERGAHLRTIDFAARHDGAAAGDFQLAVAEEQLAYLLFTSGSTGTPKGVAVSHGALAHTLSGWREAYGEAGVKPRVLSLASQAFDVWTADWVRALANGGTLVLGESSLGFDPQKLTDTLLRESITLVDLVPAQVDALFASWGSGAPQLPDLRMVVVGSDAWSLPTLHALRAKLPSSCRLLSCYGLTEAAIDSAYFEARSEVADSQEEVNLTVPLGRPFSGTRLEVLDTRGNVVPDGVPGELAVAGPGLARGYVGRAALTAERFTPDPRVAGARMYRTGDRVRRDHRGWLHFLGRIDAQLKVRGVRVEPAEIEACLLSQPDVQAACVVAKSDEQGRAALVAYVVVSSAALDVAALRAALRGHLPEVMQPTDYVLLPALPRNAHGKVDRRALAALRLARAVDSKGALPSSALERAIAAIWSSLLPALEIGVDENFFDLGGHSLLLAQVQRRLAAEVGCDLPILLLLQHPTVRSLAAAISSFGDAPSASAPNVRDEGADTRRAALFARRRNAGSKP